jgi:hypothetical protein
MKICSKCKENKEKSKFDIDRSSKDGLKVWCIPCCKAYVNDRYHNNAEYRKTRISHSAKYRNNPANKSKIKAAMASWVKKARKTNPHWRALVNLRRRMSFVLAGARKAAHSIELLGCTRDELRAHLELQFTSGMTWNNYGDWHIDHRLPCASFDLSNPDEQKVCFHYTNLQPLWAKDNLSKSDKLIY